MMFHGQILYAVYGRNVGTSGGRAKEPSLEIYDTRNCGSPIKELPCIPNNDLVAQLKQIRNDRAAVQDFLARIIS